MKLSIKQYIFLIINILAYNTLLRNFWKEGLTWSIVCDWIIPILVILFTNTVSLVIVIKMVDKKKTQHRLTIKSQGADDHIGPATSGQRRAGQYVYNGGQLMQMTKDNQVVSFAYDAGGTPLTMKVGENTYYYITQDRGRFYVLTGADDHI